MDLVLLRPGKAADFEGASRIEGPIKGVDPGDLKTCIELVSVNFGMKQQMTTDVSNMARTSGRPVLNDITCVKYFDMTSVKLYKACLAAGTLDDGTSGNPTRIYICRNTNEGKISNLMTIELYNTMISSVICQSHPDDMPTEQLTLNFSDVTWIYSNQDLQAKQTGNVSYGWSVQKNRPM